MQRYYTNMMDFPFQMNRGWAVAELFNNNNNNTNNNGYVIISIGIVFFNMYTPKDFIIDESVLNTEHIYF